MDSPPSPLIDRSSSPITANHESEHSPVQLSSKRVQSLKPIHKALSVVVISLALAALFFSSLPLWRAMGALLLQKLLDLLKFLVLTTGIGLGILNSRLWRNTDTEGDSIATSGEKEDSVSSKVPFVGMFSSEMQHSYSFDEKEMEVSENGLMMSRSEPEKHGGRHANAATLTAIARADDDQPNTEHANMPVNDSTPAIPTKEGIVHERDYILAHQDIKEDGAVHEVAAFSPSSHVPVKIVMNVATKAKVKPYDDLGLAAVVAQQPQQSRKIIHRRGSSLEFPIEQEWDESKLKNNPETDQRSAVGEKLSSSRKAPTSSLNMADHARKKAVESSWRSNTGADFPAASTTSTSKHNRSRSAYDLNELLVRQRPRSKPGTSNQLSRRRNVSLSCDLDNGYSKGGTPPWLLALPSPPEPPLVYGYGMNESRVAPAEGNERQSGRQDESSLRKAFSESLVPWRAAINAGPVEIPSCTQKKEVEISNNEQPSTKTSTLKNASLTPEASPSPNSSNTAMRSPSPSELNKKVDVFIARFHEQMRLQRLESLERSKHKSH